MKSGGTLAGWVLVTGILCGPGDAWAQGSLTPPGPPGPTMRTMEQVEPRTPISSLPYAIASSGSYYLTQNLTGSAGNNGILIGDNNVTLDLNGFRLQGGAGSLDGIVVVGTRSGIAIRNGTVRGWGGQGVNAWNADNSRLSDLQAEGCGGNGLVAGERAIVRASAAIGNGGTGIRIGAGGEVLDCVAAKNTGAGIMTDGGAVVDRSTSSTNDEGIVAGTAGIVRNCNVRDNAVDGIRVSHRCRVTDNVVEHNGATGDGAGIHATGNGNRITGNHAIGADRGLDLDGNGNYVADNTVMGNIDNYDLAAGNELNLLLCEIPETLDWPCSVKLAGTLAMPSGTSHGIDVRADHVAIDLAGHALIGPGYESGCGINQGGGYRNLRVFNGMIANWHGDNAGAIFAAGRAASIESVQANSNRIGIAAGMVATIAHCAASHNDGYGIWAADGSVVSHCTSSSTGESGIYLTGAATAIGCAASYNGVRGFWIQNGATLRDCMACTNDGHGIEIERGSCLVLNCMCIGNRKIYTVEDAAGIKVKASGCRIEGNLLSGNNRGLYVETGGNLIVRNAATGNGTNWVIAASNKVGAIVVAPLSGAISGDTGGAGVGSTDPWANVTY